MMKKFSGVLCLKRNYVLFFDSSLRTFVTLVDRSLFFGYYCYNRFWVVIILVYVLRILCHVRGEDKSFFFFLIF